MNTLYTFNFKLSDEYFEWINELIKVITVQLISHVLYSYTDTGLSNLFNVTWFQGLLFMLIAFTVYYLIVKKLFKIKKNNNSA